ncbi:hypothetical protein EV190_1336 [Actinorugispora endophytica]|uniref:Uncharacterized protein n=1 Tax=Actinorugispora endophytica TaxID=1605990 RepID=A0A4R6UP50_9ACTN|nr:hypothetical protein EV190_1336 [Actinorugispora endophytica]
MATGQEPRPLYTAGGIGAATAAAIGMATLMTFTLIGWVAAPHATFGEDIQDVFKVAVQAWLVGHHAGFAIPGGQVQMLPIGLLVLPGLLLYRSGRRLARTCELPRLRHVFQAALALAGPYAAIAGTLALVGRTEVIQPSMVQALLSGFLLAFVAGGLGVLRQLLLDKHIPRRRLLEIMPARSRSLLVGTSSATAVLLAAGALLFFAALLLDFGEAVAITERLAPGMVGGVLLFIIQLLYLPNAIIFGTSYAVGPGFALGTETVVAPTGVVLGALPDLPMLAALPESGAAPVLSLVALVAPFVAGGVGGALTLRSAPTVVSEAAPLWGFVCGVATGALWAGLALLAGGPLGAQRLAVVGPSPWQVGMITALEVGVAAAITAWAANWLYFRSPPAIPAERAGADPAADRTGESAGPDRERRRRVPRLRLPIPRGGGRARDRDDSEDLYGITYEADPARRPADGR